MKIATTLRTAGTVTPAALMGDRIPNAGRERGQSGKQNKTGYNPPYHHQPPKIRLPI